MASSVSGLRGGPKGRGAGVTIQGVEKIVKIFDKLQKEVPPALGKQMWKEAMDIYKLSQAIVPIDKETPRSREELKRSGQVDGVHMKGKHTYINWVGYGGPIVADAGGGYDYSVKQHEILWYQHLPGLRAKFLEEPATLHAHGPMRGNMESATVKAIQAAM